MPGNKFILEPATSARTRVAGRDDLWVLSSVLYLSTHMAMPMPPPMHNVAKPFFALRFCIS